MKRFILATTTMFLLTAAAAMAQNPLNTTAPGPSQETKPNQTNNDFPNPGHPLPAPGVAQPKPVTENGTVEGTATESMQRDQAATAPTATTDTTATTTTGSTTDSSYGTTNGTVDSTATGTTGTSSSLPKTGSDMPLIALFGLASLAGALALRASRLSA